jgi:putative membrane protein
MRTLLLSLFGNAIAIWVAALLVPGVVLSSDFAQVLLVALIFGLVNAFVKPVIKLLALPLIFLTLGLVTLVINAGMLILTDRFAAGLMVADFTSAFLGALVISIVNLMLGFGGDDD